MLVKGDGAKWAGGSVEKYFLCVVSAHVYLALPSYGVGLGWEGLGGGCHPSDRLSIPAAAFRVALTGRGSVCVCEGDKAVRARDRHSGHEVPWPQWGGALSAKEVASFG